MRGIFALGKCKYLIQNTTKPFRYGAHGGSLCFVEFGWGFFSLFDHRMVDF